MPSLSQTQGLSDPPQGEGMRAEGKETVFERGILKF